MLVEKNYIILKPVNIVKMGMEYYYDELKIEAKCICLFGFIPIYSKKNTLTIIHKDTWSRPKTRILK